MIFCVNEGFFMGKTKEVSQDGNVYERIGIASGIDSMQFNFNSSDCVVEGFKSVDEIPPYSPCYVEVNYLKTSKGNFFILKKLCSRK